MTRSQHMNSVNAGTRVMNRDRGDSTDTMNALHTLSLESFIFMVWAQREGAFMCCDCHVFSFSFTFVGYPGLSSVN